MRLVSGVDLPGPLCGVGEDQHVVFIEMRFTALVHVITNRRHAIDRRTRGWCDVTDTRWMLAGSRSHDNGGAVVLGSRKPRDSAQGGGQGSRIVEPTVVAGLHDARQFSERVAWV